MPDTYTGKPIGVSRLTWFPLTADPEGGPATYSTAVRLARAIDVKLSPQFAEAILNSEDGIEDELALMTGVDVTIDANQLTDEIRAPLLGHTLGTDKGMLVKPTDTPQLGALAFRALLSKEGGTGTDKYVYIVLYKGRFREFEEQFHTVEKGTINFQTHNGLTAKFVPRVADKALLYRMREDAEGFASAKIAAWFEAPQSAAIGT